MALKKSTNVNIDGKDIVVNELEVEDVLDIFDTDAGLKTLLGVVAGLPSDVDQLLRRCVDPETLAGLGMSGYMKIEAAFREVNADFLASLPMRMENLTGGAEKLGQSFKRFAGSLGKAT
jgi:hypothetical protein